jgi:hypothetical protein
MIWSAAGSRTVGVISKVDLAATDQRNLSAVQALLVGQGPTITSDVPWVALIGQSVSIATAHAGSVGSDNSLETAWRAEMENLRSILNSAPQSKLGRNALVDTIAKQIQKRLKLRLPSLLSGFVLISNFAYFEGIGTSIKGILVFIVHISDLFPFATRIMNPLVPFIMSNPKFTSTFCILSCLDKEILEYYL